MRTNICLFAVLGMAPAFIAAGPIPQDHYDYSAGLGHHEGPSTGQQGSQPRGEAPTGGSPGSQQEQSLPAATGPSQAGPSQENGAASALQEHGDELLCGDINPCEFFGADPTFNRAKRQEQAHNGFVCVNCDSIANRGLRSCIKARGWQVNCDLPRYANLVICGGDCPKKPHGAKAPEYGKPPVPEKQPTPVQQPTPEHQPTPEKQPQHKPDPPSKYHEEKPHEKQPEHHQPPQGDYKQKEPEHYEQPKDEYKQPVHHDNTPTYTSPPANCTENAEEHYHEVPSNHSSQPPAPAYGETHPTGTYHSPPPVETHPTGAYHAPPPVETQPPYHALPKHDDTEEHKQEEPAAEHPPVRNYNTVAPPANHTEEHKQEEPVAEHPPVRNYQTTVAAPAPAEEHKAEKKEVAPTTEHVTERAEEKKPEPKRRKGKMTPAVGGDYGHHQ